MAKGCGACGKMHGYSMLECIQGSLPAPTVERVVRPELPEPVAPQAEQVAPQPSEVVPPVSQGSTTNDGLTKQQRWRVNHPERAREIKRDGMRRLRAQ